MPPTVPVGKLFEQASFIVSFGPFLDESASKADLVCPDHFWLESWGDHISSGVPVQSVSLVQPVVRPLYDTHALGDTVMRVGRALFPDRFHTERFTDLLRDRWKQMANERSANAQSDDSFERFWLTHLQQGGWWETSMRQHTTGQARLPNALEKAQFFGDQEVFPLYFYPYPSMTVGYGGAHLPWLQELPDTLTTAMWGTWVEINPVTAANYGISQGDVVRIHSMAGTIEAPALLFPGLRPDVVAVPIGQGHTEYGRYAKGRGVNPLQIVAAAFDHESGTLASGATRVRIERTGAKGALVLLEQPAVEASSLIHVDRVKPS
jgi:anaerobic selenocysteine-containing dehydrogenase